MRKTATFLLAAAIGQSVIAEGRASEPAPQLLCPYTTGDLMPNLRWAMALSSGDFVIGGSYGGEQSFLALMGPSGALKRGMSMMDAQIRALAPTANGDFLVAQWFKPRRREPHRIIVELEQSVISRFDATGRHRWHRRVNSTKFLRLDAIASTASGDIFAFGVRESDRNIWQHVAVRLDGEGNLIWARALPRSDRSPASVIDATALADGSYAVALGHVVQRFSAGGDLLWARELSAGFPVRLLPRPDGLWVIGQIARSGTPGADGLLLSIDLEGKLLTARSFDATASDFVRAAALRPDGGVRVAGSVRRMGPTLEDPVHRQDGWLVSFSAQADLEASVTVGGPLDDQFHAVAATGRSSLAVGFHGDAGALNGWLLAMPDTIPPSSDHCRPGRPLATRVQAIDVTLKPLKLEADVLLLQTVPAAISIYSGSPPLDPIGFPE